jgi:hypothetical protein
LLLGRIGVAFIERRLSLVILFIMFHILSRMNLWRTSWISICYVLVLRYAWNSDEFKRKFYFQIVNISSRYVCTVT